jgi:cytochrome P450
VADTYAALSSWSSGQTRDLRADMIRLTFSIVSRTLLGSDIQEEAGEVDAVVQRIFPAVLLNAQLSRSVPFKLPLLYTPATRRAIARLHQVVVRIVQRRRRADDDRGDLLSMLLETRDEDGSALTDEEICAEALTILLAGHDTTAHTLTWCWHLLTQHPRIQEALAAEVRDVAGERELTFDDLPKLLLADRIVRETMRLYPASWWADRVSQQNTVLRGHTVPGNTMVVWSSYVTQRDARFFPRPEQFEPDRFLPARAAEIPAGAYLPFGAGVHNCIGNTFALMEARLILAAIAQRFSLHATPGHVVRPRAVITLGMADAFPVTPVRRTRPQPWRAPALSP